MNRLSPHDLASRRKFDWRVVRKMNTDRCVFTAHRAVGDAESGERAIQCEKDAIHAIHYRAFYGFPTLVGEPLDPDVFNVDHVLDGFSPTAQILMHFPSGVDLVASNASRLLPPGAPVSPPYVDTRTHDDTSLQATSPTLLIHADTGEQVL